MSFVFSREQLHATVVSVHSNLNGYSFSIVAILENLSHIMHCSAVIQSQWKTLANDFAKRARGPSVCTYNGINTGRCIQRRGIKWNWCFDAHLTIVSVMVPTSQEQPRIAYPNVLLKLSRCFLNLRALRSQYSNRFSVHIYCILVTRAYCSVQLLGENLHRHQICGELNLEVWSHET